jgi:hypothetical protein
MWMAEMARVLREGLGADGSKVPTRQVPDVSVRFAARFMDRSLREITPALGRRNRHTTEKAQARPRLGAAAGPGDGARLRQEPHRTRGCGLTGARLPVTADPLPRSAWRIR